MATPPGPLDSFPAFSDPISGNDSNQLRTFPCVLVVDKRAADSIVVSHYLRQIGCQHHIAASCEAAAARLTGSHPYDVILVDTETLGIDTAGLLPLIRGSEQVSHKQRTQIIAMSASAFEDSRNAGKFSFDAYLTKPCNPRFLAQKLGVRDLDSL